MKKIRVRLHRRQSRDYDIIIGSDILCQAGRFIKQLDIQEGIFIITDNRVARLYLAKVIESLKRAGFKQISSAKIKEGERSKTYQDYINLIKRISRFDRPLKRKVAIVVLGGGVVGDLGGFVAATYRRGVDYVQIPTTLLGQVDSGVGGKVGVDLEYGKNLVGAFWQPRLVLMDTDVLKTLDNRQKLSGLAEIIKYAVIKDERLFAYLERHIADVLRLNPIAIRYVVSRSVRIKAGIVQADEFDTRQIRMALNFGHTIGHAIEVASGYSRYTHGEAISIGMLCAMDISEQMGIVKSDVSRRVESLIRQAGLPTEISGCALSNIISSIRYDKKFTGGKNRFILPVRIGRTIIKEEIDETIIRNVLRRRYVFQRD